MGDEDRSGFLSLLGTAVGESRVRCLDHCLMGNHYHLVLEVLAEPLGDVMRDVLSVYAAGFNDRYGREGHLFERRYWAKCVDSPRYLRELVRYIAMNPVRAGLCARPEDWPWSGHRALMGLAPAGITATDALLAHFRSRPGRGARELRRLDLGSPRRKGGRNWRCHRHDRP